MVEDKSKKVGLQEFTKQALKTECTTEQYVTIGERVDAKKAIMLSEILGSIISLTNVLDHWKKAVFYGSEKAETTDILNEFWSHLEKFQGQDVIQQRVQEVNQDAEQNLAFTKDLSTMRLLHGVVGVVGESGELATFLRDFLGTGMKDIVNLKEELGDIEFYQAVIRDSNDLDLEEIYYLNNQKLAKRYKNSGFTEDSAINRDKTEELKEFHQEGKQ